MVLPPSRPAHTSIIDVNPQAYRLRLDINGFSHGLTYQAVVGMRDSIYIFLPFGEKNYGVAAVETGTHIHY